MKRLQSPGHNSKRTWRHAQIGLVLLCILLSASAQQKGKIAEQNDGGAKIRRVFLNVHGDAKSSHRMWTYLGFEMEDRGFLIAGSEQDADAIVDVELDAHTIEDNIKVGVVHLHFHAADKDDLHETCAALSHGTLPTELFEGSGKDAVDALRKSFPKARAVKLDPTSDMAASKGFRPDFEEALGSSGMALVSDESADVLLRVQLDVAKVLIEEQAVHYQVNLATRQGNDTWSTEGEKISSVKLKSPPLKVCPERFDNFDWLGGTDQFFQTAQNLAKYLSKRNLPKSSVPDQKAH